MNGETCIFTDLGSKLEGERMLSKEVEPVADLVNERNGAPGIVFGYE